MEVEQPPKPSVSIAVQSQSSIKAWRSSKKVPAIEKTPEYLASRFQGDGVRYKAKLIGIDEVPGPQGDKMCLDSMMKLKGWEVAGRQQGQHKQRVWLKVSSAGVRIVDERTGAVEHEHAKEKISSLKKDNSDPRAFSYIYGHEDTFKLFFIKMANAADPVIEDITDVFQALPQMEAVPETQPVQNGTSLLLDEQAATPQMDLNDMDFFSTVPCSPTQHSNQPLTSDELVGIFSSETQAPATPSFDINQPGSPLQSPWASPLTNPTFPGQPAEVTPFTMSSATACAPQGPLRAPYPSFNGPWEGPRPSIPQQTMAGWGQACFGPQSPGMMTLPGPAWGLAQPGYPTTAGTFSFPGGEKSPQLCAPAQPSMPALWPTDSTNVSSPFSSDA
ncbi:hypothetical protein AGOR_G00147830 [Albula goreensis]|uniref:PID domain-containing protein n=1 Tax=Albula goreensis TaxID=1534307 RepID=A0A8T3DB47_9TELE|nr:hypothetical protein AGOR_G00147830 [Albula goreensis]